MSKAPSEEPALTVPPPAFLSDPALSAVLDALPEARLVGGAVRDLLLGRPVADIDLATPRPPDAVTAALEQAGIRTVPTGIAHGTVTALAGGCTFEVTTLRRDVHTDGRHAVVAYTRQWREDAARRDFTINALSMTRTGEVFDYFDGIADLRAGRVCFVGEPAKRIAEDYLRILRFFRFFARYARTAPDADAATAIRAGIPGLARLSAERVWSELKQILAAPDPRGAVVQMAALGVLAAVLPEGADPAKLARLVAAEAPPDKLLRLAALLRAPSPTPSRKGRGVISSATFSPPPLAGGGRGEGSNGKTIAALADRLKLSGEERDRLAALTSGPVPHPEDDDAALRRLLADNDRDLLIDRTWLAGDDAPGWAALRTRLARMPQPAFELAGRDVLALGVSPGPRVGRLLEAVRQWWLAGGCVADADACRARLAALVRSDD